MLIVHTFSEGISEERTSPQCKGHAPIFKMLTVYLFLSLDESQTALLFSPVRHTLTSVQSSYKANIPRHLIVPSSKLTIGTSIGQGEHTNVLSTCKFYQYLVQNITFRGKLLLNLKQWTVSMLGYTLDSPHEHLLANLV